MTDSGAKMTSSADLRLYMITNDPGIAQYICQVDDVWPFVDLECIGKQQRQGHVDSWKSHHTPNDVTRVREAASAGRILVRINPLHEGSEDEIDDVLARGADAIMLPMFHDLDTLSRFHDLLRSRALSVPLFETVGAINCLADAVEHQPIDALHIGLNDLSLELGLTFMFECLSKGFLEAPAAAARAFGIPFGIGGVARIGSSGLPAEYVLGEHVRLGSSAAILSRSFHGAAETKAELIKNVNFASEVAKLCDTYRGFKMAPSGDLEMNRKRVIERTDEVSAVIAASRQT
ncbi:MAG: aldolase [Pseudomonadota bacterium]